MAGCCCPPQLPQLGPSRLESDAAAQQELGVQQDESGWLAKGEDREGHEALRENRTEAIPITSAPKTWLFRRAFDASLCWFLTLSHASAGKAVDQKDIVKYSVLISL